MNCFNGKYYCKGTVDIITYLTKELRSDYTLH